MSVQRITLKSLGDLPDFNNQTHMPLLALGWHAKMPHLELVGWTSYENTKQRRDNPDATFIDKVDLDVPTDAPTQGFQPVLHPRTGSELEYKLEYIAPPGAKISSLAVALAFEQIIHNILRVEGVNISIQIGEDRWWSGWLIVVNNIETYVQTVGDMSDHLFGGYMAMFRRGNDALLADRLGQTRSSIHKESRSIGYI